MIHLSSSSSPELLAPAGDWECLRAAVANGADAVYFGLPRFNARLRAENFTETDLPKVMEFLHLHGVKGYVAMNTLIFTEELRAASTQLRVIADAGVDAIIVQDLGLARLAANLTPELALHASTQMTITSPEGIDFARALGVKRVVLARELSLREMAKFSTEETPMPLEVFVHGALCVAYSGQCLTSESLGRRSANRGECAQACRMPYELVVDGKTVPLGDRRYLLSPQDLAAVDHVPDLIKVGISSFKIEGRLKSPEYVAAVTQVYRHAIDKAMQGIEEKATPEERYQLEMTFSRGLYSGWLNGVNHQELAPARYGKKRGAFVGKITKVGSDHVECEMLVPIKPGDGVVFDTGGDTEKEQGGRVYQVKQRKLYFQHDRIDFRRLHLGDRVWKTDDPELNRALQQSYSGKIPVPRRKLDWIVEGSEGKPLQLLARDRELQVRKQSGILLQRATQCPLDDARLTNALGRLGETPYELGSIKNRLVGDLIFPIGELNKLRRAAVEELLSSAVPSANVNQPATATLESLLPERSATVGGERAALHVLCRTVEQIEVALEYQIPWIYADFEDIRNYKHAVTAVRGSQSRIALATPRIQKAGEQGFFKLIEGYAPDGVLIRNLGGIAYFQSTGLPMIGDFSLNVANPLTARVLMEAGLNHLTISYDLNIEQVLSLLRNAPPEWFELTIHQHMPMFHMEHCVFAAFMSNGTDHTNCGRPCERHDVRLRDRVGMEHPLKADVGCRNTVYNSQAQTGSQFFSELSAVGLRRYRVEFLLQPAEECRRVLRSYCDLLEGAVEGGDLWRELRVNAQLGVTRGTYEG